MAISQKFLFTLLLLGTFLLVFVTYALPIGIIAKFVVAVAALFLDILAFSTKLYMSFFMPFLHMKNGTLTIDDSEAFTIAPSSNAIVTRRGGDVYASAFVHIPTYRSSSEMNQEEKVDFARLFSRALTISKTPVRFSAQLCVIDKDVYINNIKDRMNEAEERYQATSLNKNAKREEVERINGEATMWHNLFDNVNRVRSLALDVFAMVTAQGNTEEEASTLALQQADEIASGVSSVFGVQASLVEGEDILKYLEPDHMIPISTVSEEMRARAASEGT